MRLTRTGWGLLAVSIGLFILGTGLGLVVLRLLAGAGIVALAVAVVEARRAPRLTVARDVYPERVPRGDVALARLTVANDGGRRAYPFGASDPTGHEVQSVSVPALDPGQRNSQTYRLPTSRRGVVQVGPLTLTREDPLGLVRAVVRTGEVASLRVHPRTHPMVLHSTGRLRQYDGRTADETLRGSQTFHALREYVVGDEPRFIHWKSSARTGQLMVREHLDPHRPQLTVLLDTRSRVWGSDGDELFEEAVDIAASLVTASIAKGNPSHLMTTGGISMTSTSGKLDTAPVLDRLCDLQPQDRGDRGWTHTLSKEHTGSSLAVITAGADVAAVAEAARLRRQFGLVTIIDLRDGAPAASGVVIIRETTAVGAATTWNATVSR